MPARPLHLFERGGAGQETRRYVVDPETCFCFECDAITWDLLELYPEAPLNHIYHVLGEKYPRKELDEVLGEIEWLRAAKSILSPPKLEQRQKEFELDRGLRRIDLRINTGLPETRSPVAPQKRGLFARTSWASGRDAATAAESHTENPVPRLIQRSGALLLARAPANTVLRMDLRWDDSVDDTDMVLAAARELFALASMANKPLTVALACEVEGSGTLSGHAVVYTVVCTRGEVLEAAAKALEIAIDGPRIAAKAFGGLPEGAAGEVLLEPHAPHFADSVEALHSAGINVIEVNLETPYLAGRNAKPSAVAAELEACASYYAAALVKGDYFRLEPIAGLFHRIYLGAPTPRTDPAGLWSLAIDAAGNIYPSSAFFDRPGFRLGNVLEGTLDPESHKRFEDVGSVTTPACFHCWARNVCGGGNAAIHEALTGSIRTPDPAWCNTQCQWLEAAIAAFNLLSTEGTNFSRLYGQLGKAPKLSLFTMVRAAFQMSIGLRPLGEGDAELLTKWQNFNDAAYFTFTESGLLMATKYDREMDALHPKAHEFEFLLLRKNSTPMGLLRLRPIMTPGSAMIWVYLRKPADYADDGVRKSFRFLLAEAGKQQGLDHLIAPCSAFDPGLAEFLVACGFEQSGIAREALFLRGGYHDVTWFGITLGTTT